MGRLKNTKTLTNLMHAFVGESQARNRYTFFASRAKKEGYVQIQGIFLETAQNEKEHGEIFYKYIAEQLTGGEALDVNVEGAYPVSLSNSTIDNLLNAANGEHGEWAIDYPAFADVAEKEGFADVADSFRAISISEKEHEHRFRKLAANIQDGTVFKRNPNTKWKCGNCGYIFVGAEAPDLCPACKHAKAYFELFVENF